MADRNRWYGAYTSMFVSILTLYMLKLVSIFSLLLTIYLLLYWQGEFGYWSKLLRFCDQFFSQDLNEWFSDITLRWNYMLVILRVSRVKHKFTHHFTHFLSFSLAKSPSNNCLQIWLLVLNKVWPGFSSNNVVPMSTVSKVFCGK